MYDDDYATCARCYATLLVYPGEIDPVVITQILGIEPSHWQRRGELTPQTYGPPKVATLSGWFLRSDRSVKSRDSRRHIDWLLDRVTPQAEAIRALQDQGCRMEITCFWTSQSGHGGPTLPSSQMKRLADLNLELWFDFYGPYENELGS